MKCSTTSCIIIFLAVFFCHSLANNDPCTVLGLHSSYDAIVVGSGPGGSVSARRLAEFDNKRLKVLQIERGWSWAECTQCQASDLFVIQEVGFPDLVINTEPQTALGNSVLPINDHSVQGGGSSVNGEVWIRPDGPHYYDTFFPANWNWDTMKYYHAKVENYTYPEGFYGHHPFNYAENYRGRNGLLSPTQLDDAFGGASVDLAGRFVNAVKQVYPNIPASTNNSLNNGQNPGVGTTPAEGSFVGAYRHSAFLAYILSYTGTNLKAISHTRVQKILFEGTTVVGVEVAFMNITTGATISDSCTISSRTVVVSAGALGTPKLLMLSGVGPAAELRSLNIPVVVNNTQVGQNLDDQFAIVSVLHAANGTLPANNTGLACYGLAFWNTQDNATAPPNMALNIDAGGPSLFAPLVIFTVYTHSKGYVALNSVNPAQQVKFDPKYITDQRDFDNLALALRQNLRLIPLLGLQQFVDPCASKNCTTNTQLLNVYFQYGTNGGLYNSYSPGYHYTGTAALGKVIDPNTMGVYGTTGLYVNDASALVVTPAQNTQNPTYALAERGIELIIAKATSGGCW